MRVETWRKVIGGGLLLCAALLFAPGASADHGFGGSLEIRSLVTGAEPAVQIGGYLSFEITGTTALSSLGCNGVLPKLHIGYDPVQWGNLFWGGSFVANVNGVMVSYNPIPYSLVVEWVDPATPPTGHCRFAARIMAPDGVTPLIVPVPVTAILDGNATVEWRLSARDDGGHVNNGGRLFRLAATTPVLVPNAAPVTAYNRTTQITAHGSVGYGNHHCPQPGICQFWVPAKDPDGDPIRWELAGPDDADPAGNFMQPDGLTIDPTTGLARWDTTVGQRPKAMAPPYPAPDPGEIYSAQFLVSDELSTVPIDIIIEVIPGETCPDGTPRVIDPWTGEFLPCESDPCVLDPTLDECLPICERSDAPRDCFPVPPPTIGREPEWHYWPAPEEPSFAPPTVSGAFEPPVRFNDVEGDGMGDSDRDGIKDHADMCPGVAGGDVDFDLDGRGDACDPDDDNDGVVDEMDCDHPDLACTVEETAVRPVSGGSEGSRGARTSSSALPAGGAAVELKEADARSATPVWILGGVAAAMFLLVIAASRGRQPR